MRIKLFDPMTENEHEWWAVRAFNVREQGEYWPEDPPMPLGQLQREWRYHAPLWEPFRWFAWTDSGEVVGFAQVWVGRTDENPHAMDFHLFVLPEYRGQGLATRLLAEVVDLAQREGRTLLITGTGDVIPSGGAFLRRLGANEGMTSRTNQLNLAALDHGLMWRWIERAQERAAGFTVGEWINTYPDADIEAVARLYDATNDAPRDNLAVDDEHRTPEQLRAMEKAMRERGDERWTVYARDTRSGDLAAFTEVFWNATYPEMVWQGWTAVKPQYRNLGLGRWIKAAMIEKVLQERPYATRVRTGNAESNAAMLGINNEMGFRPIRSWTVWQIERAKVEAYLAAQAEPVAA